MPRYLRYSFLFATHISFLIRESVYCTSLTRMVLRSTRIDLGKLCANFRKVPSVPGDAAVVCSFIGTIFDWWEKGEKITGRSELQEE
jgi:hypothetical protein